jgi:hypothetical protein
MPLSQVLCCGSNGAPSRRPATARTAQEAQGSGLPGRFWTSSGGEPGGVSMRRLLSIFLLFALIGAFARPGGVLAARPSPDKDPVAVGKQGAVATVDPDATRAGIRVLRRGGNAVDAAVAAAAALGVTEPYSAGIGGGGFMLVFRANTGTVEVIDGPEEAPDDRGLDEDVFLEFTSGDFLDAVNSGLSVGVPGTMATWVEGDRALGSLELHRVLQPRGEDRQAGLRALRRRTMNSRPPDRPYVGGLPPTDHRTSPRGYLVSRAGPQDRARDGLGRTAGQSAGRAWPDRR